MPRHLFTKFRKLERFKKKIVCPLMRYSLTKNLFSGCCFELLKMTGILWSQELMSRAPSGQNILFIHKFWEKMGAAAYYNVLRYHDLLTIQRATKCWPRTVLRGSRNMHKFWKANLADFFFLTSGFLALLWPRHEFARLLYGVFGGQATAKIAIKEDWAKMSLDFMV